MKQTHIPYGFVAGILMAIISLIIYLTGAAFKPGVSYICYLPFLAGVIMNAVAFSKANDGFVTFGNVFGSCFKASMIVTIVVLAWSIISVYAFPEMKEQALTKIHEEILKRPGMTDDQIDMAINIYKKYWNYMVVGISISSNLFYGAIFSLIGAAAAKKKGTRPFLSENAKEVF